MFSPLYEPDISDALKADRSNNMKILVKDTPRKLTGAIVLMIFAGFFGTIGLVDGVMVWSALSTFSGQVSARPYEDGLAYNQAIAKAEQQNSLGWRVDAKLGTLNNGITAIDIALADSAGVPLENLSIIVSLASPVNKALDKTISLAAIAPGRYRADVAIEPGKRMLGIDVQDKGTSVYHSVSRILLAQESN